MNEVIGREIENETGVRLSTLTRDMQCMRGLSDIFSRVHAAVLQPRGINVENGERSVEISVAGCRRSGSCGIPDGSVLGCLPDRLVSAIMQALLETPVGLRVSREDGICTRRFSPVWLVELLAILRDLDVRSFVVLYGDRVVHSFISSEADGEVLNRAVLKNDEADRDEMVPQILSFGGIEAVMFQNGKLFVAVTSNSPVKPLEFAGSLAGVIDPR
jgi:hypothetical protein